jgi:hypothetical protein
MGSFGFHAMQKKERFLEKVIRQIWVYSGMNT